MPVSAYWFRILYSQWRNHSSPLSDSTGDSSDSDNYFDIEPRGSDPDTNLTDIDTDIETGETTEEDEDEDYLLEYYYSLEEDPVSDNKNEDYKEASLTLIDGIEERFHQ